MFDRGSWLASVESADLVLEFTDYNTDSSPDLVKSDIAYGYEP